MSQDKHSMGGRFAPGRYVSNHAYDPITPSGGLSIGCLTTLLALLAIVIYQIVQLF